MVYLIHFEKRFKHARHYLGFSHTAAKFARRIENHGKSKGSALMRAVTKAGIKWRVVRTWKKKSHDGNFERRLKFNPRAALCPVCSGPSAYRLGRG